MAEPYALGIADAARQIREKHLSPVTLAQSLLNRIDRMEPALQAWVTIDREEVLRSSGNQDWMGIRWGPFMAFPLG